ncbi:MAG: dioxygenase [Deltaproteobacteria bacterium]|nr:dioxygenase [Deltaproteobacteria bacterium]
MSEPHRRRVLTWLSAAAATAACGKRPGDDDPGGGADYPVASARECERIPQEAAGPFPADGSNGVDVLSLDGIVRSDIRPSIGVLQGSAVGVPLTLRLTVVDGTCAPVPGAAVYVWQCDREAHYSLYTLEEQNYLRGVQVADAAGIVEFVSIFPGCYPGRWPHVHFAIYESLEAATTGAEPIATSQLAFTEAACVAAYGAEGYEGSVRALDGVSLATDGVFRDDDEGLQLADVEGDPEGGFVAALTVGV